jgi:2-hydroxy-6-oxonona-2,4-dienedioate hydrolase
MPLATVNGHKTYYEVGGEGEMAVLLHGAFADADIMEAPATGLASGFRVLRFDRRGHGRSAPLTEPISLSDEANDVAQLLDWFGASGAHLLSHDEGAEVAIEFALAYPDRTLSLALLAPTVEGFAWDPVVASWRSEIDMAMATETKKTIDEMWLPSPMFDVTREKEGMFDRVAAMYRRYTGSPSRFPRVSNSVLPQASRLAEIQAPTLILVGDRDEPDRLRCAEFLADAIPGAELVTFPGLSHFLHIEESRPVMRRLTDFYIPEGEIER